MGCQSKRRAKINRCENLVLPISRTSGNVINLHELIAKCKIILFIRNVLNSFRSEHRKIKNKFSQQTTVMLEHKSKSLHEDTNILTTTPPKCIKVVTPKVRNRAEQLSCMMKHYFTMEKGKSNLIRKILYPAPSNKLVNDHPSLAFYVSSMSSVLSRMDSYKNWTGPVSASKLVGAGFFCDDRESLRVKCFSCELILNVTDLNGEDPLNYHKRKSPLCSFISDINTRDDVTTDCAGHRPSNARHNLSSNQNNQQVNECHQLQAAGHSQVDGHQAYVECPMDFTTSYPRNKNITQTPNSSTNVNGNHTISYPLRNPQQADIKTRKETFNSWTNTRYSDTDTLSLAGFFFTGDNDTVRCFCCDIGLAEWTTDDDPWLEHARHSSECDYLKQVKGEEYVTRVKREWQQVYNPRHKNMEKIGNRLASFTNWPQHLVTQTPRELALAGFFYTGEGDTVRCHYCDGGIREWEAEDDVWIEHAHWFPFCKYVLRVKGSEFIREALARSDDDEDDTPVANLPAAFANQSPDGKSDSTNSYEEECRRREKKNPLYSAAAQSLFFMDYSRKTVSIAINNYIAETGRRDFKATDLMNIVSDMEDRKELFNNEESDAIDSPSASGLAGGSVDDVEEFELTPAALSKENERLSYLFTCVNCKISDRQIVYAPCGHRLTCQKCSEKEEFCSHCNVKITNKIKTYFG